MIFVLGRRPVKGAKIMERWAREGVGVQQFGDEGPREGFLKFWNDGPMKGVLKIWNDSPVRSPKTLERWLRERGF